MIIEPPLKLAWFKKRYKRFLADVYLPDTSVLTLHCPNTGSMKNCLYPGNRVWYSDSGNPKRKYPCTWYFIEDPEQNMIGIHTGLSNRLVREAILSDSIVDLAGYRNVVSEKRYGIQNSRIDLYLSDHEEKLSNCYVEVKNVSLLDQEGVGLFPDAVTLRGQKHLEELILMRRQGYRAVLVFCVQHSGIERIMPADQIDPVYGGLLRKAVAEGVEVMAYGASFDMDNSRVELNIPLPVCFGNVAGSN